MARQEAVHSLHARKKTTKVKHSTEQAINSNNSNRNSNNILDQGNNDENVNNAYQRFNGRAIMPLNEEHLPNTPHPILNTSDYNNIDKQNISGKVLAQDEYYK